MSPPQIGIGRPFDPLGALLARAAGPVSRSRRVSILLAGIVVMSLADLDMTLAYARSVGLLEGNPLARLVMTYGCPWMLALWKAASVGLCVFILYRTRRTRYAELAAWACFLLLVWLSVRWMTYNDSAPLLTGYLGDSPQQDSRWVTLGSDQGAGSE